MGHRRGDSCFPTRRAMRRAQDGAPEHLGFNEECGSAAHDAHRSESIMGHQPTLKKRTQRLKL